MNAIEAVARALAGRDWDAAVQGHMSREEYVDCYWDAFQGQARAALTALRDNGVTEGMWLAWLEGGGRGRAQATCDKEFRAMLDAALEGE